MPSKSSPCGGLRHPPRCHKSAGTLCADHGVSTRLRNRFVNCPVAGLLIWLVATDVPVGTELQYAGTLVQQSKAGPTEVKSFTVNAVSLTAEDGGPQMAFWVDERGGGSWGWP